jgi:DnaJ-domain-containing protein 1
MSSMWRRALRMAQSNIGDLKDRATSWGRGPRSLGEMSDAELEAELERRRREHLARAAADEAKPRAGEPVGAEAPAAEGEPAPDRAPQRREAGAAALDLLRLPPQRRRQLRQYYANLELPFGADLDEVKQAFRRLMRQYHPDKHQADPARRQLATQLSQKLTVAYNELMKELKDRKKD